MAYAAFGRRIGLHSQIYTNGKVDATIESAEEAVVAIRKVAIGGRESAQKNIRAAALPPG
jgi:hypothetical protein